MSSRVNLTLVAREAGLAVSTVSLILNDKAARIGISEATILRVKQLADKLGYTPNQNARSLRLRRSGLLGMVLSGLSKTPDLLLGGVRKVLEEGGEQMVPLLASHDYDSVREQKELRYLIRNQVEAIIATPKGPWKQNYAPLISNRIPLVFAVHGLADAADNISGVYLDSEGMARAGVDHVVAGGARRIAYLTWDFGTEVSREKLVGVKSAVKAHGRGVSLVGVYSFPVGASFSQVLEALFADRKKAPDALVCNPAHVAARGLDFLRAKGIAVPEQCALVSLNDHEMFDLDSLNISAVSQDTEFIGRRAAEVALDVIRAGRPRVIRERHSCFGLVQRSTTHRG